MTLVFKKIKIVSICFIFNSSLTTLCLKCSGWNKGQFRLLELSNSDRSTSSGLSGRLKHYKIHLMVTGPFSLWRWEPLPWCLFAFMQTSCTLDWKENQVLHSRVSFAEKSRWTQLTWSHRAVGGRARVPWRKHGKAIYSLASKKKECMLQISAWKK